MDTITHNTQLIIVGAGAAGLMAAITARELGLPVVLLERKHQPGRKLLMCGNNRCNLTHHEPLPELLAHYGHPVGPFLEPALTALPPATLCEWFETRGLRLVTHKDRRVFPHSEKAADVLHFFTDRLRAGNIPIVLNCPAVSVAPTAAGLAVETTDMRLTARYVLLATGGVSYPKTGSVGDGQRFAKDCGHRVLPYRPGLAGFDLAEPWLTPRRDAPLPGAHLTVLAGGKRVAETHGEILFTNRGAYGPAMVDASRAVARLELRDYTFEIDTCPQFASDQVAGQLLRRAGKHPEFPLVKILADWLLPETIAAPFARHILNTMPNDRLHGDDTDRAMAIADALKHWGLKPLKPRPLKEAMVTVGGVALDGVDPASMQSRHCPGLYLAGEVLDIDGPTGGFNLQAAFATAQLAARSIAEQVRTS